MRVLGNIPAASAVKNHSRNIEIDVVKEDLVEYTDKVIKDPRIKKYGRPSFSESEVKEKMDIHKQKKAVEKLEQERRNAGKMNKRNLLAQKAADVKAGKIPEVPVGDVGINDPNDSNTRSKLKDAVKMGSFGFSQKEREVLNQILGRDA